MSEDESTVTMEDEDLEETTFENDMDATIISSTETTFRPLLAIINAASQKVAREKNKTELEYSVDEFIKQYPKVNGDNFFIKATFDFRQAISNARCFYLMFKQLPPFPQSKVSTVNEYKILFFFFPPTITSLIIPLFLVL